MKGHDGCIYNLGKIIQSAPSGVSKGFGNTNRVGILLDMNKYTIQWFVNGEARQKLNIPDWKGTTVYPAASHIQDPDTLTIDLSVKPPLIPSNTIPLTVNNENDNNTN